jgi:branched-chain amino acid aminotransferase
MMETVWLNGDLLPASEARISVFDGGFLHGAGLFETMRAEHRRVFRLDRHLQRLRRSAARLLSPLDENVLPDTSAFESLLERNGLESARIRLTVTSGELRGDQVTATPTVIATATQLSGYPAEMHERGIAVAICAFRTSPSDPLAGHKSTSYLPRLLGLRDAQQARCSEAIWFTTSKHLAEGSISNIFVIRDGVLRTPPLDTPVLPGIARELILELAGSIDLKVEETPLGIDDLLDADEVFLTNSMMQVMPVVRVEKHEIRGGVVGTSTRRLLGLYQETVRKECRSP